MLLDRTRDAMQVLIDKYISEEPAASPTIDDDGLGNGPYKMKLTIWREGEEAWFDWSGTEISSTSRSPAVLVRSEDDAPVVAFRELEIDLTRRCRMGGVGLVDVRFERRVAAFRLLRATSVARDRHRRVEQDDAVRPRAARTLRTRPRSQPSRRRLRSSPRSFAPLCARFDAT